MDSNSSSAVPAQPGSKTKFAIAFGLLSTLGFLDALYLTINHYTGGTIKCNLLKGCDIVTNSEYSEIWGVPVALLGVIFYVAVLVLSILYLETKDQKFLKFITYLSPLGFLAAIYFTSLQAFVINAWCQYCLLSAILSTSIFLISIPLMKTKNAR